MQGPAKLWLAENKAVGAQVEAAMQPKSRLLERNNNGASVQGVFRALIKAAQPCKLAGVAAGCTIWDKRGEASVCGPSLMPDTVISVGSAPPLPSSTVALVDLKRQDRSYDCGENWRQVRACNS